MSNFPDTSMCRNRLLVRGYAIDLERFRDGLGEDVNKLLEAFLPCPPDLPPDTPDEYPAHKWREENWDTQGIEKAKVITNFWYEFEMDFRSAWTPPIKGLTKIAAMFPKLEFKLDYKERYHGITGTAHWANGALEDHKQETFKCRARSSTECANKWARGAEGTGEPCPDHCSRWGDCFNMCASTQGYAFEMMAEMLGRPVAEDEWIEYIDGNYMNVDPSNLRLTAKDAPGIAICKIDTTDYAAREATDRGETEVAGGRSALNVRVGGGEA